MPNRSLSLVAALLLLRGVAEAAPPDGTPVFIQVQGFAPTSIGQNGFIVAGDFTEGGAFQWMPTSGVKLVGGGNAYISRDGKAMVGAMADSNGIQQAVRWLGGRSWQALGALVPGAVRCDYSMSFAMGTSADGRVAVGGGYYGTDPAHPCDFYTAYRWEESTGYTLMPSTTGSTRAHTTCRQTAASAAASTRRGCVRPVEPVSDREKEHLGDSPAAPSEDAPSVSHVGVRVAAVESRTFGADRFRPRDKR